LVNYLSAVDNRRDVSLIEWAMAWVRALQFVRPPIVTGLAVFKTGSAVRQGRVGRAIHRVVKHGFTGELNLRDEQ
jgi:hypothetical protein